MLGELEGLLNENVVVVSFVSLILVTSSITSARRSAGTLRSKAQARCNASISLIQVNES